MAARVNHANQCSQVKLIQWKGTIKNCGNAEIFRNLKDIHKLYIGLSWLN